MAISVAAGIVLAYATVTDPTIWPLWLAWAGISLIGWWSVARAEIRRR